MRKACCSVKGETKARTTHIVHYVCVGCMRQLAESFFKPCQTCWRDGRNHYLLFNQIVGGREKRNFIYFARRKLQILWGNKTRI